ncbi:MAG: hypothetical protein ACM3NR_02380 [Methanosarcina sp.]
MSRESWVCAGCKSLSPREKDLGRGPKKGNRRQASGIRRQATGVRSQA